MSKGGSKSKICPDGRHPSYATGSLFRDQCKDKNKKKSPEPYCERAWSLEI